MKYRPVYGFSILGIGFILDLYLIMTNSNYKAPGLYFFASFLLAWGWSLEDKGGL